MKTTPEHEFYVDNADLKIISGWGWYPKEPHRRMNLSICVNEEYEQLSASTFRADLQAAGKGDGNYAFSYQPPQAESAAGRTITIKDEFGNILFTSTTSAISPSICFDISDVLIFLAAHGHPSGIQRVQLSILREVLADNQLNERCAFILYQRGEFLVIPSKSLMEIIRAYTANNKEGLRQAATIALGRTAVFDTIDYHDQMIIVSLGATWIFEDYYDNLYRLKSVFNFRTAQVVYDLIPLRHPHHCASELVASFRQSFQQLVRGADSLIAISDHTAIDIQEYALEAGLQVPPPIAIPMGTDPISPSPKVPSRRVGHLENERFVLFVSTVESRKNHRLAIDVWRNLKRQMGGETPYLVFAGRKGWRVDDMFAQLDALSWLDGTIIHLDTLTDGDIAWLYSNCLYTIFPSLSEGWGLPVTESLTYGKVCVASNMDSIGQAGQGLAHLIPPHDLPQWTTLCKKLASDEGYLKEAEATVRLRYRDFSWKEYTSRLFGALETAGDYPVNTSFLEVKPNFVYKINIEQQQMLRRKGTSLGNPASYLDRKHWHTLENHGVWARVSAPHFSFVSPREGTSGIGIKIRFPGDADFGDIEISVNSSDKRFCYAGISSHQPTWLYLPVDAAPKTRVDIKISMPKKMLYRPENDERTIGMHLEAFCLIAPTSESPLTTLAALASGISLPT